MTSITYHYIEIEGLDIFYREAGNLRNPSLLLLHGFPGSSHMFRNLIERLRDHYHLIAPDLPGSATSGEERPFTFDSLAGLMRRFIKAAGLERFSLCLHDLGGSIGLRTKRQHPSRGFQSGL